jgi:hypothetical protein
MPPCEVLLDVLLGLEALHELDDLQVGHIDLGVLGGIEVLLGVQDALLEEILVNLHPVLLGNQHGACLRSPLRTRDGFAKKLERGGERATLTGRSAKGRSASRTRTQKGLLPLLLLGLGFAVPAFVPRSKAASSFVLISPVIFPAIYSQFATPKLLWPISIKDSLNVEVK